MLSLEPSRLARYREKMRYILDCLAEIQTTKRPKGLVEKGVWYCLLTSIKAAMDLISMLIKDFGKVPKGDKENIEQLKEMKLIDSRLAKDLRSCNGLRNILVHRYNGIDHEEVRRSLPEVDSCLRKLLKAVEVVISGPR